MIKPTAEMEDVEKPGADQYMPSEIGARTGEATFKIRPTAPSANPAWAMALLPGFGLGWNGSTAFVLDQTFPETVGSTVQTLSLFAWEDGILKSIYGSAGMLRISGTAGKTAIFDCTFRGKWAAPVALAKPTITYPTNSPLRFVDAAMTLTFPDGDVFTPKVSTFTLDLNNELYVEAGRKLRRQHGHQLRPDPEAAHQAHAGPALDAPDRHERPRPLRALARAGAVRGDVLPERRSRGFRDVRHDRLPVRSPRAGRP